MRFGLAWLGLCGLAWLGFWPEAKPCTTLHMLALLLFFELSKVSNTDPDELMGELLHEEMGLRVARMASASTVAFNSRARLAASAT